MIRRHAARAVLLCEPDNRVLLLSYLFPHRAEPIWLLPGGGIEPDESAVDAVRREVEEETGLTARDVTGPIWRRQHTFRYNGDVYEQSETIFLVRTPLFDPSSRGNPAELEAEWFQGFKWWSVAELAASRERLVPASIARHVTL